MAESDAEIKNEQDSFSEDEPMPSKPRSIKRTRIRKQGECVNCKRQMKIEAKNMCLTCYRNSLEPNCCCLKCMAVARVNKEGFCRKCYELRRLKLHRANVEKHRECKSCKQIKFIFGHGLCQICYRQSKPKVKNQCQKCGQTKILHSKNTCATCQQKKRAKTDIRMCKNCGKMRPHKADQMCHQCYNKTSRTNPSRKKECVRCKQVKHIYGRGMCENCCYYSNKEDTSKHKKCAECKQIKPIHARECCNACYQKIFSNPKRSAKKRLAKQLLVPKVEETSSDEDLNERPVSPIDIKDEFKMENLSANEMRSVSPISMEDFKLEPPNEDEFDPDQPGPSWKY